MKRRITRKLVRSFNWRGEASMGAGYESKEKAILYNAASVAVQRAGGTPSDALAVARHFRATEKEIAKFEKANS